MKALFTLALFLLSTVFGFALDHKLSTPAYAHLNEVNAQWLFHQGVATTKLVSFESDVKRIRYHLTNVEAYLRSNTPENLNAKAKLNREMLLNVLHEYAAAETFPTNTYHVARTPYFIDNYNVYCAVGHLISKSGHDDLARNVNAEHRYDFIRDIKTNGLAAWADEHGFTVNELAWIQPAYAPTTAISPVQGGTDGPIDVMYNDYANTGVIFAGEFSNVNGLPCMNIGQYKNSQLECFGNGLVGMVHDVIRTTDGLIAVGNFGAGAVTHPVAVFDGTDWNYVEIPDRDNAEVTAISYGGSPYKIAVALSHAILTDQQEIWLQNSSGTWEKKATVNGIINDIEPTPYGHAYVGQFSSIVVHDPSLPDETVTATNVVFHESYMNTWFGIGSEVSENVLTVESVGMAVYFGGSCSNSGTSNICVTRYFNGTLQPLVLSEYFSDSTAAIHDLELYNGNSLLMAGDFNLYPWGVGNWSKNLAAFDLVSNYLLSVAAVNEKVTSLATMNNEVYFGGDFTMNEVGSGALPHLAKIDDATFLKPIIAENDLVVFPNPASDNLTVGSKAKLNAASVKVYDVLGRTVLTDNSTDTLPYTLDVSGFDSGVYVLTVESKDNQRHQQTFVIR